MDILAIKEGRTYAGKGGVYRTITKIEPLDAMYGEARTRRRFLRVDYIDEEGVAGHAVLAVIAKWARCDVTPEEAP